MEGRLWALRRDVAKNGRLIFFQDRCDGTVNGLRLNGCRSAETARDTEITKGKKMTYRANIQILALASLIAAGGSALVAQEAAKGEDRMQERFTQMDTNGDGALSQEEIQASADARFAAMDADGDGFLTAEEMQAAAAARRADRGQRMLERLDADGNGSLSAQELAAMGEGKMGKRSDRMMQRMDANEDGKLSPEEMAGRHSPERIFEKLDADEDGSVSAEEFADARMHGKHHGKKGAHGMHKMHGDKAMEKPASE